jgi:hypothetical protein
MSSRIGSETASRGGMNQTQRFDCRSRRAVVQARLCAGNPARSWFQLSRPCDGSCVQRPRKSKSSQRPKSSSASRLTAAQVRVLDLSQSAASPGAAVRVLALEDAFDPEQAIDQATVRPRAPYTPRPQARDCSRTQAPTAESSPAPENFFAKTPSPERATPFLGAETIFGQVFGRGGMSTFQNPKVPHIGGGRICRTRARSGANAPVSLAGSAGAGGSKVGVD